MERPTTEAPLEQRYLFIDLFRGAAILFMLQGHTFRALLDPAIKADPLYQSFELFHGITAPAFLFGAGLTFVISTRKRWREYHSLSPHLLKRISRMLLVVLLGIALHVPYFSLRKILTGATPEDMLQLFQFDILHCIGVGLLVLQALIFLFRKERRFYGLVLVFTTAVPLLTPLAWDVDVLQHYPPIIAQAFNARHGSPFPLFPFAGFLFVGVVVSWEFLRAVERNEQRAYMRRLLWLGAAIIVVALLLDLQPLQLYPTSNFWYTSPNYFGIRVGMLLIVTVLFWHGSRLLERASRPRPAKLLANGITLLGKESLFVYVLHLPLIFGSAMNPRLNLLGLLGTQLTLAGAFLVFCAILLGVLALAAGWNFLKTRKPVYHRMAQVILTTVFLFYFLTRQY